MENSLSKSIVYLVGGGPGDPGLLTLRGKECLEQADFVLYDQLASMRMLDHAPPQAERVCISELPGTHPDRWPHIHERLIEEARKGKIVVRLKGGDPLIFGRGGEEAEALREAGIRYEIIPGVTAAFAAGAYAEIPLTHRSHSSAIAIVTGHEHPNKVNSRLDWKALSQFPGTLAIYMGVARLPSIARELLSKGKPGTTPVAVIHKASTGDQRTVTGTLADIDDIVRQAGIASPSLVLVGNVVQLKPKLSWFEAKPLLGIRVLVTRPQHQSGPSLDQLDHLGAVPYNIAPIEIVEPSDSAPIVQAIQSLRAGEFDWVVFTSANGVHSLLKKIRATGHDLRVFGRVHLATIGQATAKALREYHLEPDLVPSENAKSETLLPLLADKVRGQKVLLAQAAQGHELLRQELPKVATVQSVVVYEQREVIDRNAEVFDFLRRGEIDVVTLTSPNIAKIFMNACDTTIQERFKAGQIQIVTNSRRLTEWVQSIGASAILEAKGPTMEDMIERLLQWKKAADLV